MYRTLVNEATSQIFRPTANFENFKVHLYFVCRMDGQPAYLPAVRLGCARCRAPEISHNKDNGSGFTKILFRRRFSHCAMVIPFILHPFLVLYIFLRKVRISPKVMIACNGFCLLRHTKPWLARDIISIIQWHDVFACTLLHRELRDYPWTNSFWHYLLSHCYHTAALSCKCIVNKRL